jgi:catechol 2,3-dioxygenase-like lactoylglutathione lyase family enzyme
MDVADSNASWPNGIDAVTLFVEDLAATKAFYRDVFGLPVLFEDDESAAFGFGRTAINLLDVSAAAELVEPGTVGSPAGGSRFVITLEVDDVDRMAERLTERGATLLNGPMDRPWGVRTASFADPAGYVWEIARKSA